jgi:hypothetical protein
MKTTINPKPYYSSEGQVKAFVLGADPTNPANIEIEFVFGINSGDRRYFASIERNLNAIGLAIDDVYVQNLVQEYLEKPTTENDNWETDAERWLPVTKKEFDEIDPSGKLPVLDTAERIMKFLYPETPKAKDIYFGLLQIPVTKSSNNLGRPLIPFYRHLNYNLNKCPEYKKSLIGIFKT